MKPPDLLSYLKAKTKGVFGFFTSMSSISSFFLLRMSKSSSLSSKERSSGTERKNHPMKQLGRLGSSAARGARGPCTSAGKKRRIRVFTNQHPTQLGKKAELRLRTQMSLVNKTAAKSGLRTSAAPDTCHRGRDPGTRLCECFGNTRILQQGTNEGAGRVNPLPEGGSS